MDLFQKLPRTQYNGHCWVQCSNVVPIVCYKAFIHVNVMDLFQELPRNQHHGHCWVLFSNVVPNLCYKAFIYQCNGHVLETPQESV